MTFLPLSMLYFFTLFVGTRALNPQLSNSQSSALIESCTTYALMLAYFNFLSILSRALWFIFPAFRSLHDSNRSFSW
uniref:Putative secreted peptide n=1 Tax=Anopheles braziliensis TaxID=58242 RepID=A0A2M3ZXK1_9DIPT